MCDRAPTLVTDDQKVVCITSSGNVVEFREDDVINSFINLVQVVDHRGLPGGVRR
jgi:hypothetical protein